MKAALVAWVSVCLLVGTGLFAHHGTSEYEMNTEVSLTGAVKEWTFSNPHSWLKLTVNPPRGAAAEEWSIESAPPSYLASQGWSISTLKAGETLTATISPKKGQPKNGILLEVKRPSGETLMVRPPGSFGRPAKTGSR